MEGTSQVGWKATRSHAWQSSQEQLIAPYCPVQRQSWWLEILRASEYYREAKVIEGGRIIGLLPYFLQPNRLGFLWGRNPEWTNNSGPVLSDDLTHYQRQEVLESLIEQLPNRTSFYFFCTRRQANGEEIADAFRRHNFVQRHEVTFQVFPEEPDVLSRMKSKYRSQLKAAMMTMDVCHPSPGEFIKFYEKNLKARGLRSARSLNLAQRLLEEAVLRGSARIFATRRRTRASIDELFVPEDYEAAIACIWDTKRYHYWMSTYRTFPSSTSGAKPHKDAVKVLILKAMEHAKALNLIFDTDGATTAGAEHLYSHILQIENAEGHDVFMRTTALVGFYERCRGLAKL